MSMPQMGWAMVLSLYSSRQYCRTPAAFSDGGFWVSGF